MSGELGASSETDPERLAEQVSQQAAALPREQQRADELRAQFSEQAVVVRQAAEKVRQLRVSVGSADGLIQVQVGPLGQLSALHLDNGVYDHMAPAQLAEVITGLARDAKADAAEQAREILGLVLPGGLPEGREWWEWLPGWAESASGSGGQE